MVADDSQLAMTRDHQPPDETAIAQTIVVTADNPHANMTRVDGVRVVITFSPMSSATVIPA